MLSLPEQPDLPDSVFVEDTAVVLDECAVLTRPGAESRRPETESIEASLAHYRKLFRIEAPARMDGGDVLQVGKRIYVGLSRRTDTNAIEQLQDFVRAYGYEVKPVPFSGCLHLKSAVTQVATDALLVNTSWVEGTAFSGMKLTDVDPSEAYAANGLLVGDAVIYPCSFPRTRDRLQAAGIRTLVVEADELAKAEGAVTCCSLIFEA